MTVAGASGFSVTYGGATNASVSNSGVLTCASISTSGTITSGGNAVLTTTYNPFYCACQVNSSGNLVCSTGSVSFTSTQHSTGIYWITYSTAYPNSNYVILATVNNASCYASAGSATSSSKVEILAINSSTSAYQNQAFYFMVF